MKNCEDEDYAYGTEKQKQIDAKFIKPHIREFNGYIKPQMFANLYSTPENEMLSIKDEEEFTTSCKPCPPRIGATCPDIRPQKFARTDPHPEIPFVTDEDNFPSWPLALSIALAAMLACWGLFCLAMWLGRL